MSATLILNGSLIPRRHLPVYLICDLPHVANLIYTTPPTSVPLLRSLKTKERTVPGMGRRGQQRRRHLPMVVLGLLASLLAQRDQRVHRRPAKLRPSQGSRRSQPRLPAHPRAALQLLPDGVRSCDSMRASWCDS